MARKSAPSHALPASAPAPAPAPARASAPAPAPKPTVSVPPQYAAPPFLVPPDPEIEARRRQRKHNTARWTGAVVLAVAVGAACAFAVTIPKRTDIPGLATASDGRYVFPPLALPTLPPGQPVPGDNADNPGGQHLSDIQKLLLPAPKGAVRTKSLPGPTGWLPESALIALSSPSMTEKLGESGLRHTAAEGWKTPDGASTAIYLLQFPDSNDATTGGNQFIAALNARPAGGTKKSFTPAGTTIAVSYYTASSHNKKTQTQYGYFTSGDTEVLVVFSAPTKVSIAPFEQEIQLQAELLQ
jgi:hypothetical protein